jgi:copper chaperone CopZ
MTQVVLRIDGMRCGSCVRRIGQALQSVPGIRTDEIRVGAVRLEVQNPAETESAIAAINNAGYTAYQESAVSDSI